MEAAEGFTHEALIEGGEDGFDGRELQESSFLPVLHDDLAEVGRRALVAGDRHQDQIRPFGVVTRGADDDRGALLRLALVGEGDGKRMTSPKL